MGKKNNTSAYQHKKTPLITDMKRHKWLYLMVLPGVIWMIIFCYLPMGGLVFIYSEFVGLDNFKKFFTSKTVSFWSLFRNTLSISLLSLALFFPAPIILSLMLNELRCMPFKRISQTLVYIPHFVSLVIVASLTQQLFNSNDGAVYQLMKMFMGDGTPKVLTDPKFFNQLIVGQSIWKETGYGTIIFLAALSGVDMQLYEAMLSQTCWFTFLLMSYVFLRFTFLTPLHL